MHAILILWGFLIIAGAVGSLKSLRDKKIDARKGLALFSTILLGIGLFVSLLVLLVTFRVFAFGGSSYAQYSYHHELWSLWFDLHPKMLQASLVGLLTAVMSLVFYGSFSPRRNFWLSRASGIGSIILSIFLLLNTFPDA